MEFEVFKHGRCFIVDVYLWPEVKSSSCRVSKWVEIDVENDKPIVSDTDVVLNFKGMATNLADMREWLAGFQKVMFLAEIFDAVFKTPEDFDKYVGVEFHGHFGWRMVQAGKELAAVAP